MHIKTKIWFSAAISVLLLLGCTLTALIYLTGTPLFLTVSLGLAGSLVLLITAYRMYSTFTRGYNRLTEIASNMEAGRVTDRGAGVPQDELDELAHAYHGLAEQLLLRTEQERMLRLEAEEEAWLNRQASEMAILLQGSVKVEIAAGIFMSKLAAAVKAHYGVLYVNRLEHYHFAAGYAYEAEVAARPPIPLGQGLVGQCAFDKKPLQLDALPDGYFQIRSALGEATPTHLLIVPILFEQDVIAVIELASFGELPAKERRLIDLVGHNLGILLNTLADVARIDELLRETQNQKEELLAQTEELQQQSEELLAQTEELHAQKQELEAQTEELLAQTDELQAQTLELSDQAGLLAASNENLRLEMEQTARQKEEIQRQADELLAQTEELQQQTDEMAAQTEELALANRHLQQEMALTEQQKLEIKAQADEIYLAAQHKSEFLANVSHELRTPLNSLLILSQILAENREGNLQAKQLEYVHTIFSAGKDLLQLIDEILDLAKLETGKMQSVIESASLHEVADHLFRTFEQQAQKKGLKFDVRIDQSLPDNIMTDSHRLRQVLRNLLSNALKFTEEGSVYLDICKGSAAFNLKAPASADEIVFSVTDTGIGISAAQVEGIFEAFQQADGTTSRKYGGTGLGLTISRELAQLLGGRIEVDSAVGQGSTFSLILPVIPVVTAAQPETTLASIAVATENHAKSKPSFMESFVPDISISNPKLLQYSEMADDRADLAPCDTVLLIIEDDAEFASSLLELARSRGFKAIVAFQGDQGLALAHAYKPNAILLDTDLPVMDGWSIISRLKSRPELRHIPVHVISTEETNQHSLSMGALSFWKKPSDTNELAAAFLQIESYITRPIKSLLIVEDNTDLRKGLVAFIAHPDVAISAVGTGREALEQLSLQHFDCMVLDLGLADISGFDLLEQIKTNRKLQTLPVIIYTGKELGKQDEQRLKHYAESIVIKNVRSMERLYDETALYLHRRTADLPPDKQRLIEKLHNPEAAFEGRHILLVDDDMRNIFALSSVLESYNMEISFAQNGIEALAKLEEHKQIELVFMDIMMPEMDGYETMRRIRSNPAYAHLVIIALTARAMDEDRQKCLEAGASDYIPKPINTTQLVTMLKTWLIK